MDYRLLSKIFRDLFRVDRIPYISTPVVTLAHDNDRSLFYNGKYYSPLVNTVEDDVARRGIECQSVARIVSTIKGDLAYGNAVSPEGGFARALVTKRLKGLLQRGRYPYSYDEEKVWDRVLRETGATKVIGILPSRELCVACHKRGIWVADIQHGVIADAHPWYGEKYRGEDPPEYLPNAFYCWDRGAQQAIEKWSLRHGVHAPMIGNRWLARFIKTSPDDALVQDLLAKYRALGGEGDGRPTILLSLSWGETRIPNGFICDGLERVIKATSGRYRWLVRLHPNQIKGSATDEFARFLEYYRRDLSGHIEWEAATRTGLPVVLKSTDLHISWVSSCCIEASQMGIRSAMLDPMLRGDESRPRKLGDADPLHFAHYQEAGMIDYIPETYESILGWVEANIASRRSPESYEAFDQEYEKLIGFLCDGSKAAENRGA